MTSCGNVVVVGPREDELRVYTGRTAFPANELIKELLPDWGTVN